MRPEFSITRPSEDLEGYNNKRETADKLQALAGVAAVSGHKTGQEPFDK
jgi:hypothetical protein